MLDGGIGGMTVMWGREVLVFSMVVDLFDGSSSVWFV